VSTFSHNRYRWVQLKGKKSTPTSDDNGFATHHRYKTSNLPAIYRFVQALCTRRMPPKKRIGGCINTGHRPASNSPPGSSELTVLPHWRHVSAKNICPRVSNECIKKNQHSHTYRYARKLIDLRKVSVFGNNRYRYVQMRGKIRPSRRVSEHVMCSPLALL